MKNRPPERLGDRINELIRYVRPIRDRRDAVKGLLGLLKKAEVATPEEIKALTDVAVSELITTLRNEDFEVRGNAILVLEQIGGFSEEVIHTLRIISEGNNGCVGSVASSLLRKIDPKLNQSQPEKQPKFVNPKFAEIRQQLQEYNFEGADRLFQSIRDLYPENDYLCLKNQYQKEYVEKKITALLECEKYVEANELFLKLSRFFAKDEYEKLKSQSIKKSLTTKGIELNDEQSLAIAKTDQNLLLTARAGSGKTLTIGAKTVFLTGYENINPDEILILAFNKDAATEIQTRISRKYGLEDFRNARTFHSLAHQIVRPKPDSILFDEKGDFSPRKQSRFVQKIAQQLMEGNPEIKRKLYLYFRKELQEQEIERYRRYLNEKEYKLYRRNLRQVTLKGERVKSNGEKYIADFLFEHGIEYDYERVYYLEDRHLENRTYRPDFTLYRNNDIVIEHWGIDESNPNQRLPDHWTQTWEDYYNGMQRKRNHWRERGKILVETSIRDLYGGRKIFECVLKSRLERVGVICEKLSEEDIIKKIVTPESITRMTELFVQFIQRAKKNERTVEAIQRAIDENHYDERAQTFLEIANQVYKEYNAALTRHNKMDFDDLMVQAAQIINASRGEVTLDSNGRVKIKDLKWILIDEYQDFSKLFNWLIQSIRNLNPNVRLFCVGDNWQAINGFAGSNLEYFDNFKALIENSGTADLLTNYRSDRRIIEKSNRLMEGRGHPSQPSRTEEGEVDVFPIDDIYVDMERENQFVFYRNGQVYDSGFLKAKYLKRCYEIIANHLGKTVAILARTNRIYGVELSEFHKQLKRCFSQDQLDPIGSFEGKIKIRTVHRFKGLEADIVIILQACNGTFPLIHPDNHLFEIFEHTIKDAFDEERRLFYVAMTRAKEKLYILTEGDRESDYLDALKASGRPHEF
ncbi:UvrD-helicase domain-containing protein [Candidatus Poribacteria bacterium]|nr:UvrD-helicase domain-containing protein [Candidatus Poribacteria bacterium]